MNSLQNKLRLSLLVVAALSISCKSAFPPQTKEEIPADHTTDIKGVMHKDGYLYPYKATSGCSSSDCHQDDLDGGVATVEGQTKIAPSCFQCHGTKWSDDE